MSNKLIINILGKGKEDDKKTAAIPSRKLRKLGRRRIQRNRYLRIFDFGQYVGGATIPWHLTFTQLQEPPIYWAVDINGQVFVFGDGPTGMTQTLLEFLLLNSEEDWKTLYQEVTEDIADYNLMIDGVGAFEPDKGLLIDKDVETLYDVGGIEWDFDTLGGCEYFTSALENGSNLYYTLERDPDAEQVDLIVDKSIDVFLVPSLFATRGEAQDYGASLPPFPYLPQEWKTALTTTLPVPRSTIGSTDWDTLMANRPAQVGTSQAALDLYRAVFINNGKTPVVTSSPTLAEWTGPPGFSVASYSFGYSGFPSANGTDWHTTTNTSGGFSSSGPLVAAVRKRISASEDEWYYVWTNSGSSAGNVALLVQDSVDV